MTEHTQKCLDLQKRYQDKIDAWVVLHPNYCKACDGFGEISYSNSVDYGSTTVSMPGVDICGKCIENAKCPHCGSELFFPLGADDEAATCSNSNCGWTNYKMGKDGLPPQFEGPCECERKEMLEFQQKEMNHLLYSHRPEDDWLEQQIEDHKTELLKEGRKEMISDDPDDSHLEQQYEEKTELPD